MSRVVLAGRTAVLATMHGKERVIAPALAGLGITVEVASGLDTDRFGTFTREIERTGSQREAAHHKAMAALALTGGTLAVASEGSFGPHPSNLFVPVDREIVLLVDTASGLEVVGEHITIETNYARRQVANLAEAKEFARRVGFPDHGLVVESGDQRVKGIVERSAFERAVSDALAQGAPVFVETDMRAMVNPTRMEAIAQAARDLVVRLGALCPRCAWPGFGVLDVLRGLACAGCGLPTDLVRSVIEGCERCGYRQEAPPPGGRQLADPAHCHWCNP